MLKFLLKSSDKYNPENLKPGNVKNILIVRQHNQLGDMLCSVPLFAAIRKKYPEAHITLVASPINYEILFSDINPFIDKVITYRKAPLKNLIEFYKELKYHDYQIGIVPSTVSLSRTSHLINYFSGAKVRVGVRSIDGKINDMEYLLNIKSDFNWDTKQLHQIDRNLDVGRQIDCDLTDKEKSEVMIHLSKEEISFADEYMKKNFPDKNKLVLGFHPGAGKVKNRWDNNNFIELMKMLYEKYDCYLMMTSGSIDKEITDSIRTELKNSGIPSVTLENTPIRKLSAVIKNLTLYITNDTGTLHVAGGVDANVISLFGPTHGYEWAPIGKNKFYIQSPTDDIDNIKVEDVYNQTERFLNSCFEKSKKLNLISQNNN